MRLIFLTHLTQTIHINLPILTFHPTLSTQNNELRQFPHHAKLALTSKSPPRNLTTYRNFPRPKITTYSNSHLAGEYEFFLCENHSWSGIKKEQVRNRQYGKCNMCFTSPSKWKYDYFDGNKDNDDLYNCQGLCSDCYSVKTKRDNRISIYQKSN